MQAAIATDFNGGFCTEEEVKRQLTEIAEAGFSHIHWCFDWDGEYQYSAGEMRQIRMWMEERGLKSKGLHATKGTGRPTDRTGLHYRRDFLSDSEVAREAGVELIRNRIDLAAAIGSKEIVLHFYLPFRSFAEHPETKDLFYRAAFRSMDELAPYCREKGVKICAENLFEAPGELQIEEFTKLAGRYPAEVFGICLDTGHANLVGGNAFISTLFDHFSDRIFCVHMHDNNGWGDGRYCGDAHQIPGCGSIDWKNFMTRLRASAYEMPVCMELNKPGKPGTGRSGGDQPESDEAFLARALEAAEWLYSL